MIEPITYSSNINYNSYRNSNMAYKAQDKTENPLQPAEQDKFETNQKRKRTLSIAGGVIAAVVVTGGAVCYAKGKGSDGAVKSFGERMHDGWRELCGNGRNAANEPPKMPEQPKLEPKAGSKPDVKVDNKQNSRITSGSPSPVTTPTARPVSTAGTGSPSPVTTPTARPVSTAGTGSPSPVTTPTARPVSTAGTGSPSPVTTPTARPVSTAGTGSPSPVTTPTARPVSTAGTGSAGLTGSKPIQQIIMLESPEGVFSLNSNELSDFTSLPFLSLSSYEYKKALPYVYRPDDEIRSYIDVSFSKIKSSLHEIFGNLKPVVQKHGVNKRTLEYHDGEKTIVTYQIARSSIVTPWHIDNAPLYPISVRHHFNDEKGDYNLYQFKRDGSCVSRHYVDDVLCEEDRFDEDGLIRDVVEFNNGEVSVKYDEFEYDEEKRCLSKSIYHEWMSEKEKETYRYDEDGHLIEYARMTPNEYDDKVTLKYDEETQRASEIIFYGSDGETIERAEQIQYGADGESYRWIELGGDMQTVTKAKVYERSDGKKVDIVYSGNFENIETVIEKLYDDEGCCIQKTEYRGNEMTPVMMYQYKRNDSNEAELTIRTEYEDGKVKSVCEYNGDDELLSGLLYEDGAVVKQYIK